MRYFLMIEDDFDGDFHLHGVWDQREKMDAIIAQLTSVGAGYQIIEGRVIEKQRADEQNEAQP